MISPNQHNFSEHKKALRIRSQRIQQREWIIHQKRQSSTNIKPNQSSSTFPSSRSGFKIMRKDAPFSNQLEDIPKLVHYLSFEWNSFHTVLDTVRRFRKILSHENDPPIDRVIESGAVQYFAQLLDPTHIEQYCQVKKTSNELSDPSKLNVISLRQLYELQFEATWCIRIIVGGTGGRITYIVEMGCVPQLINLIESEDSNVRYQCVWAIGNIGCDSDAIRDYIIGLGVMKHLVKLMETDQSIRNRRKCVWTISKLLGGTSTPTPEWDLVGSAIPLLCQLILNHELEEEVLSDACWSLSFATYYGPPEAKEYIAKQDNLILRLLDLLNNPNPEVQTPALNIVGDLLKENFERTQKLISCGLLPCFKTLLLHSDKDIKIEVLWTLLNITHSHEEHIQAVIDAEIFPTLFSMSSPGSNESVGVKNEIYDVVTNVLAKENGAQTQYLIDQGVTQHFCDALEPNGLLDMDHFVLGALLDGLELILRYGKETGTLKELIEIIEERGGYEKISDLRRHPNENVCEMVLCILDTYW